MRTKLLLSATIAAIAFGVALPQALAGAAGKIVEMKNVNGQSVGTATLAAKRKGVQIKYNFKNLPLGEHALHIHQNASCEADPAAAADAFKSAGGHFNPEHKQHGLENPAGPHAGDMPNFTVGPDGTAKGAINNPRVTLNPGDPNSVFANNGTSLVVHGKADDMKTDPAGNAGPRIACGVVTK